MKNPFLSLPPNHLIHYPDVALDDFHHFRRDILVYIVGDGEAVVAVLAEANGGVYGLEQGFLVNAGDDEVAFVDGLGTFRAGADANGGEGMAYTGEETAFLGKGATVADHGEGVHLETVVVVEAERLVLNDTLVEMEATGSQTVAAAGMAAVEDGHIVFLCHLVDGAEERKEVFLCVDVFFTMGTQQDIPAFFQTETLMYVAGLYLCKVLVEHLGHWRTGDVGALLGQSAVGKIATGML